MAKIVCIEDEAGIREDIAEALEMAGHAVVQAANGVEGLAAILREKPDLALSDIAMPEMNGHDLLRELRENHPSLADMPFVFLSARADRADQILGRSLGADEYLTKPVDFELMRTAINSRLRQVQRMRQQQAQDDVTPPLSLTGMSAPAGLQSRDGDDVIDTNNIHDMLNAHAQSVRQILSLLSKGLSL